MDEEVSSKAPFIDTASVSPSVTETEQARHRVWRTNVFLGAGAGALVLFVNIGVLIWAQRTGTDDSGIATVYTGSCSKAKFVVLWADLAVNVASTILLSASNHCAQLLSSPSRDDIDRAHTKGRWLEIGVPSIRNLLTIPGWRVPLWVLLFASSVPLHLLYNSVVFNTLSATDYQASLVTEDFVTGGWWNQSRLPHAAAICGDVIVNKCVNMTQLEKIQQEAVSSTSLTRLDNEACLEAYPRASDFETDWRNVLLVTNLTLNDTLINVTQHEVGSGAADWWPSGSSLKDLIANPQSWTLND